MLALFGALSFSPAEAFAHQGTAVARLQEPKGVGTVVDDSFTIVWIDADAPVETGTATIELHYTSVRPPPFDLGEPQPMPGGELIAADIPEEDLDNTYVWDTSNVPPGSYWLWSIVNEPEEENSVGLIAVSPGVVTVAHAGDEVSPAVILKMNFGFDEADESYTVRYEAFDPDGTGRVRLEGRHSADEQFLEIARDLPAVEEGRFEWDTSGIESGPWVLKATITDARSMSFESLAPYKVRIVHATPPGRTEEPAGGCRCVSGRPGPSLLAWGVLVLLGLSWLGRSRSR